MRNRDVVIVGAGRAGHALARSLRHRDGVSKITLVSAYDAAIYPKAALAYALGLEREPAALVQATAEMAASRERLHLLKNSPALGLDLAARTLQLERVLLPFERLVLALGEEMTLPPELAGTAGVFSINRLADYALLRARLAGAKRVVVAGSGVAACEFANDLAASGRETIMIDAVRHPLGERLPGLAGARLQAGLRAAGVQFRLDDRVLAVEARGGGGLRAHTAGAERFDVDLVVALPTPRPRVALAQADGLRVARRGIVVDARLHTDGEGIYALGACAVLPDEIRHAGIEAQAEALARTLSGEGAVRPESRPEPRRLNTPACALVLLDPPEVAGEWQEHATASGVSSGFFDERGRLCGFALVGSCADARDRWLARLDAAH